MTAPEATWLSEREVVGLLNLPEAIDALEAGLRRQAAGLAVAMDKTHLTWGSGNTLHAIGAVDQEFGVVATKSWTHTMGGACPLLLLWSTETGALVAIIEAFALGQMRTGGISGVATRWMAREDADCLALIGTGKQALAQLAAVAAVRPLKRVRIWGRDPDRRRALIAKVETLAYGFAIEAPASVAEAADGADIITLVTRAREPFFTSAMAGRGAHINAIGAVTPEREEFAQDVLSRAGLIVADDPATAMRLSREFTRFFTPGSGDHPRSLAELVAARTRRPADCDLSLFKAMGMGLSDLALGAELLRKARIAGAGRPIPQPVRSEPRLTTTA